MSGSAERRWSLREALGVWCRNIRLAGEWDELAAWHAFGAREEIRWHLRNGGALSEEEAAALAAADEVAEERAVEMVPLHTHAQRHLRRPESDWARRYVERVRGVT